MKESVVNNFRGTINKLFFLHHKIIKKFYITAIKIN
jgi:hypothetical protein